MADYTQKHQQTQPLTSYTKSEHIILHVPPIHRPPPPKRASKCFVYFFAFFVLLCLLLLIFSLTILRPKPLQLHLASHSLKSLSYNQSPSFSAAFAASISIRNPNFTPLRILSASISFLDGIRAVGSGSVRNKIIGARNSEVVKVSAKVAESTPVEDWEKNRLRDELNSGVLYLKGVVRAVGEVVLFKIVARKTYGEMECDISIDLRSQQLLSFVCS